MNLLKDPWLPIIRKNGAKEKIAIHQLLDNYKENPVMELEAPRLDFRNALYQLLIGIVQVASMPEDEEEWGVFFEEPYSSEEFSKRVLKYEECFEIDSEGPAFMQDFELEESKPMSLAKLFLDSPSDNALNLNADHFVKRDIINAIDPYWGAVALYALQTFTAGIGSGHRVGLRGGGPLTTVIKFDNTHTLWENIWINIISEEMLSGIPGNYDNNKIGDIFPWMKPTKKSTKSEGLYPEECHKFHHYFGMPVRLRLSFNSNPKMCDVTGDIKATTVVGLLSRPHGNNYSGAWLHPLNAYRFDSKKEKDPISIKAQPTGIDYRCWGGLVVSFNNVIPARNITISQESNYRRDILKIYTAQIWVAGFDTDKGKTRNWYESSIPFFPLDPQEAKEVTQFIGYLISQAQEISGSLRFAVKSAWFGSPKDAKGDMGFLDTAFWQNTESAFYSILDRLVNNLYNDELRNNLVDNWGLILKKETESIFDANALAQQEDGLNMKRVVKARIGLGKGIAKMFQNLKSLKELEE